MIKPDISRHRGDRGASPNLSFHQRIKRVIKQIPRGKVCTYGLIAARAGNPLGAREVVRVLHHSSGKDRLPWHRVINRHGRISLPKNGGYEEQKARLEGEGVKFDAKDGIHLDRYLWEDNAQH